jgi:hypothetical protein
MEVLMAAVNAIGTIGGAYPHAYVEKFIEIADEIDATPYDHPAASSLSQKMIMAIQVMQVRHFQAERY